MASGFDGLYNVVGGCGCQVSDLSPASCMTEDCRAGHKVPCDPETCDVGGKCEWHIGDHR